MAEFEVAASRSHNLFFKRRLVKTGQKIALRCQRGQGCALVASWNEAVTGNAR